MIRLVYSIAERIPGREQPAATGEMYAVDFNGKGHGMIYGARALEERTALSSRRSAESSYAFAEIISTLEADDKNVLIAEYKWKRGAASYTLDPDAQPQLYVLDVNTGTKRSKGKAPLARATVLVDQNDQPRFATGYNSARKLAVSGNRILRAIGRSLLCRDSAPRPCFHWSSRRTTRVSTFTVSGKGVAARSVHGEPANPGGHKILRFPTGRYRRLALRRTRQEDSGAEVAVDKPEIFWLDKDDNTAKIYRSLQKALPDQHLRFVSASRDGHLLIARAQSDVNPGDYYLFDTQAMKAEFLVAKSRWIDPRRMRPKEPFAMKARDGLELRGYLTRAEGVGPHR